MALTYDSIATTTLSSAQSSVTFSSISGSFTDLVLVYGAIGNADLQVILRLNNDTASNYSTTFLGGNGTTALSTRESNVTNITTDYNFSVTTSGGVTILNLMNYSNTTTNKTILCRSGNGGKGTQANVGLWRSTSAINRVDLITTNSTFASGSTFTLYGIKAA